MDSPNALVRTKGHVLSGGMSENATREFVVPRLQSTGAFMNPLTNNEKAFLERVIGELPWNTIITYVKHPVERSFMKFYSCDLNQSRMNFPFSVRSLSVHPPVELAPVRSIEAASALSQSDQFI